MRAPPRDTLPADTQPGTLLSVVVPVYRNASDLRELLRRARAAAQGAGVLPAEYIFVDDGSPDESFQVLSELAAEDPQVRVVRLSRNFGSNAAILAGLFRVRGAAAVVIAADLQDPPELIPEMVRQWRAGSEVVLAARRKRDDPFLSRLSATVFNRLFRRFVFPDFPADGFDFVLLDKRVVDAVTAMPERNSYIFGQIMWVGFRRAVVPYDRGPRAHGRSAWTFWRKLKYFIDAFTAFSYLPLRFVSMVGLLMAGTGFAYALFVAVMRLRGNIPERGFAALMVAVLVGTGAQLLVTGLIGEYLWRVLEEVRPRPHFVVAESLNLGDAPDRPAASDARARRSG
jgi:dolichol-phosphate mannosyltransferase